MIDRINLFYRNFSAMGTRFEVALPGLEPLFADSLFNTIREEVLRLDNKLSRFSPKSMIRKINQLAAKSPVRVDTELWEILSSCITYSRVTHGAFDVTIRPMLELWELASRKARDIHKPSPVEIKKVFQQIGSQYIILNSEDRTVHFEKPGMEIDLGGFGKGYALEKIEKILHRHEIQNGLLSFGDSSILGLGHPPHGREWRIGIQHPQRKNVSVYEFSLINRSLSTSGSTHNYKKLDTLFYGHTINPRTGCPSQGWRTISVSSDSALEAEILSTALMVMDRREKQKLLQKFTHCQTVEIHYNEQGNYKILS